MATVTKYSRCLQSDYDHSRGHWAYTWVTDTVIDFQPLVVKREWEKKMEATHGLGSQHIM